MNAGKLSKWRILSESTDEVVVEHAAGDVGVRAPRLHREVHDVGEPGNICLLTVPRFTVGRLDVGGGGSIGPVAGRTPTKFFHSVLNSGSIIAAALFFLLCLCLFLFMEFFLLW